MYVATQAPIVQWMIMIAILFISGGCGADPGTGAQEKPICVIPLPRTAERLDTCGSFLIADLAAGPAFHMQDITKEQIPLLGLYAFDWCDLSKQPLKFATWLTKPFGGKGARAVLIAGDRCLEGYTTDDDLTTFRIRSLKDGNCLILEQARSGLQCQLLRASSNGAFAATWGVKQESAELDGKLGVVNCTANTIHWSQNVPVFRLARTLSVMAVAASSDGACSAVVGSDGTGGWLLLVDAQAHVLWEKTIQGEAMFEDAAFSPDGRTLYCGGTMGAIYGFDVPSGRAAGKWLLGGEAAPFGGSIIAMSISPDGKWIAAGTGPTGTVFISERQTGKDRAVIETGDKTVFGLAFSPDSRLLASTGAVNHRILVWTVPSASQVLPETDITR